MAEKRGRWISSSPLAEFAVWRSHRPIMTVREIIEAQATDEFLTRLKTSAEALIMAITGKEIALTIPTIRCIPLASTFRDKYTEETHFAVGDDFGAPAFAVDGKVYFNGESPDWIKGREPNVRKIISTMVHEFFHSVSYRGKGVQEADDVAFRGPGSFMYMDEVITDMLGYILYDELGLAADGHYETAYIVNTRDGRQSMKVGAADGAWLSLAFLFPAFAGIRKKILCAYFFGDSLRGVDVDLPRCVKAIECINRAFYSPGKGRALPDVSNGGGLGFTYNADKGKIAEAILGDGYGPFCTIEGNAIPVTRGATLKAFLSAQEG